MSNHPNRGRSSGNTVTLVRRRSGFADVRDAFRAISQGEPIDELNEEIAEYYLPSGYKVAESNSGDLEIYAPDNKHCEIIEHKATRRPQLASGIDREMPVLKRKVTA